MICLQPSVILGHLKTVNFGNFTHSHLIHFRIDFIIFKKSSIAARDEIEKNEPSTTLEKDNLSADPSFDDTIYKDVTNYDEENSELAAAQSENNNNVYERESEQSLSSFTLKGRHSPSDDSLRESADVIN